MVNKLQRISISLKLVFAGLSATIFCRPFTTIHYTIYSKGVEERCFTIFQTQQGLVAQATKIVKRIQNLLNEYENLASVEIRMPEYTTKIFIPLVFYYAWRTKVMLRRIYNKIFRLRKSWRVFLLLDTSGSFRKIPIECPSPYDFIADPFILKFGGTYFVICEGMDLQNKNGDIILLKLDEQFNVTDCRVLLTGSNHFSFPSIEYIDDKLIVCPETISLNKLCLWIFDVEFNVKKKIEIATGRFVDPQIIRSNSGYSIFATEYSSDLSDYWTRGVEYKLDSELNILKKVRTAYDQNGYQRNGGIIHNDKFKIILKQKPGFEYGSGIIVQKLPVKLRNMIKYEVGNRTHHVSSCGDLYVYDEWYWQSF